LCARSRPWGRRRSPASSRLFRVAASVLGNSCDSNLTRLARFRRDWRIRALLVVMRMGCDPFPHRAAEPRESARCRQPADSSQGSQPRYDRRPSRCRLTCAKIRFALAFRTIADIRAPCLKTFEVGARRNFAEQVLAREPDLDVEGLGRRKSDIRSA